MAHWLWFLVVVLCAAYGVVAFWLAVEIEEPDDGPVTMEEAQELSEFVHEIERQDV